MELAFPLQITHMAGKPRPSQPNTVRSWKAFLIKSLITASLIRRHDIQDGLSLPSPILCSSDVAKDGAKDEAQALGEAFAR